MNEIERAREAIHWYREVGDEPESYKMEVALEYITPDEINAILAYITALEKVAEAAREMVSLLADHADYYYPRCKGWPNECHACNDVAQFICQALSNLPATTEDNG